MKHRQQTLAKTAKPIRRRRDRAHHPCPVDLPEPNLFPPRRCSLLSLRKSPRHIRPSIQDVQRNGLPLCEVALFQNAAIPSPLAAKPERDTHLQLKAASRTSSLRSPAASARSIRSRSTKASLKDTYEARTWRNRLRRHSVCHSFPPECLFLSNEICRSHQDYMSQLHAAHHASSKRLQCGEKALSGLILSATSAVFSTPNAKLEADHFFFKETSRECRNFLKSLNRVHVPPMHEHEFSTA
ncbi:hypothetical protein FOXG_09939 [Fusarium oxysporum f. sp. lycopersici 4287]|uniref:Uncharacterized protein n=3 Tax=Fusarium oxysporum TaxID=5507 RepID=W9HRN6_FUSOX|nr:hypothetical protein FOXG_09939 [Fusarium oxysporum f. sp. lycopersici 4287]EWY83479.1 hypothetical protein FOYG_13292 [Fusarium oxysporum NRRL 32931]EXK28359.1 hypothetical protein FOMG_15341 [Fusarium oxysporum f. sp. melonis 26406]KNB09337.1 hypothetical protein FOXG_09939 [Fusarium oxysporum f. sp. lycopersici 4287]